MITNLNNMKTQLFLIISLFTGIFSFAQKNTFYPQTFFDKKQAQEMISYGKSTIEGVASTKQKNAYGFKAPLAKKQYAREGTVVMLFPCTEYFNEWYKLRSKKENKKTQILMSEDAFKYRIEATTDAYGRFKFEKMKPGKYYLEAIVDFTATSSYRQQTATETGYNAYGQALYSTPVYSTFFYNYNSANRENKFVEIKEDGQLLEIKL